MRLVFLNHRLDRIDACGNPRPGSLGERDDSAVVLDEPQLGVAQKN